MWCSVDLMHAVSASTWSLHNPDINPSGTSGRKVKKCPGKLTAWLFPSFAPKMIFLQRKGNKKQKWNLAHFGWMLATKKVEYSDGKNPIWMNRIWIFGYPNVTKWTESEWPSLLITPFWQRQWQSFCDSFSTVGLNKEAERSVQFQDMPLYLSCLPLPSLPILLCSSSSNQIFSNSAKLVFFWFSVYTTFLHSQTPLSCKLFLFFSCFSSTKQICFS